MTRPPKGHTTWPSDLVVRRRPELSAARPGARADAAQEISPSRVLVTADR